MRGCRGIHQIYEAREKGDVGKQIGVLGNSRQTGHWKKSGGHPEIPAKQDIPQVGLHLRSHRPHIRSHINDRFHRHMNSQSRFHVAQRNRFHVCQGNPFHISQGNPLDIPKANCMTRSEVQASVRNQKAVQRCSTRCNISGLGATSQLRCDIPRLGPFARFQYQNQNSGVPGNSDNS